MIHRSILARLLLAAAISLALMGGAGAQVVGAPGEDGASCSTADCGPGGGADGESASANGDSVAAIGGAGGAGGFSVSAYIPGGDGGNGGAATAYGTTSATAVGGNGGAAGGSPNFFQGSGGGGKGGDADADSAAISNGSSTAASTSNATGGAGGEGGYEDDGDGAGGNASAGSSATANGSGNATSSATATGGGVSGFDAQPGSATASASATAKGSGSATASATATLGFNTGISFNLPTVATSYAETAEGGLAQAQAQAQGNVNTPSNTFEAQSTAKTTFGGVSVQSAVELFTDGLIETTAQATAQGGSGQSPANSGLFNDFVAFSTALPNAAYAAALIGGASNVADALLGPDDTIFGTAILGGVGFESSTFDFSFRGDLILGVVTDDGFSIIVNGADVPFEDAGGNSLINLGFISGPIDLTIEGDGVFAIGGAVPEPSTWAMMLAGFAGIGFMAWRRRAAWAG